MEYNELRKIAESKKIEIGEIANQLEMTSNGFRESIRNETIQLKKLKLLCETLRISPLMFFELSNQIYSPDIKVKSESPNKMLLVAKDREIELLKQQVSDKNEIIRLLRQVNSSTHGYGNVADK